ncbi:DUF4177 domain-containing protein [Pseudoxanthomonas koreensis]|uniref:DUF4177 domain-containing protein n=1 Tax=Pseudoxanthomonas koreensis TaxID=266061 RepID=UPI0035A6D882
MSTRWQYQVVEIKPGMMGGHKQEVVQEALVRPGQQGWELVQVVSNGPIVPLLAVFKRPA